MFMNVYCFVWHMVFKLWCYELSCESCMV